MEIKIAKYSGNPILTPRVESDSFEKASVYNPAAIVKDDKVYLLYRAEEAYYDSYISRVGLAVSEDGCNFKRHVSNPIMSPESEEESRGIEDLRIIQAGNKYFLTYTAYAGIDEQGYIIELNGAFSKDCIHWERMGKLVPGREKAGAIIQDYKYQEKYVMYFGEGVVRVAFSADLKNWEVQKEPVLEPREGYFDDFLIEGGPPPIITDEGILMIYNSAKGSMNDKRKREYVSYQPGFALFDKQDPTEYWEQYGKVNYVVFANGLVNFKNKWLLYYGGADKSIGVAELTF
jgi:predicted GH43/DUF377 family glycosyl hydrolase